MTIKELRRKVLTLEATALASNLGLGADELRRWASGGINATVENAVRQHFEHPAKGV